MGKTPPGKRVRTRAQAEPEEVLPVEATRHDDMPEEERPWWDEGGEIGKGLRCRQCNCPHIPVVYTRSVALNRVKRHRKCRHCGYEFDTYEG